MPYAQEIRLLPLDLLHKQSLANFEIYDETGRSLSYFTHIEVSILTGTMLTKYAEGLLDEPLPYELTAFLYELATRVTAGIQEAQETWERKKFASLSVQVVKDRLAGMVEFTSILMRLTNNFILLVPTTAAPGTLLKMRYYLDAPIQFALDSPPKQGLAEQLGWRCTRIDFRLEAAADTEIYHFEVEDPPGVDLAMATIYEYSEPTEGGAIQTIIHDWQRGGLPRLNLRVRDVQPGSAVVARVAFRSSRQGWLPAFVTCSWAIALLLAVSAWRLPYILHLASKVPGANPVEVLGIVATALIFLGGVIAVLVARSDERGLARKILSRLRQLALFTAALPAVAVAGLLFIPTGAPLRWTWLGLAMAALLAAVLSTFSYLLPKYPSVPPSPYSS